MTKALVLYSYNEQQANNKNRKKNNRALQFKEKSIMTKHVMCDFIEKNIEL